MAAKKSAGVEKPDTGETSRIRRKVEYRLQRVYRSGNVEDAGLVLHYPSELDAVKAWLKQMQDEDNLLPAECDYRFVKQEVL